MLFNTNMINETFELVNMLKLNQVELKQIQLNAVEAVFDETIKEELRNHIGKCKVEGEEVIEITNEEAKEFEEVKSKE